MKTKKKNRKMHLFSNPKGYTKEKLRDLCIGKKSSNLVENWGGKPRDQLIKNILNLMRKQEEKQKNYCYTYLFSLKSMLKKSFKIGKNLWNLAIKTVKENPALLNLQLRSLSYSLGLFTPTFVLTKLAHFS